MKAFIRLAALSAAVALLAPAAEAVQAPANPDAGAVSLPIVEGNYSVPTDARAKTGSWGQFLERNPSWFAEWNPWTGTPHRAFGKGIRVTGAVQSKDQATQASLSFLQNETALTKAAGVEIVSTATLKGGRVWYAHFEQQHEGIPLLNSDVTVRLGEDGKVFAFGADVHTDIKVSTKPTLSAEAAKTLATEGLTFDPNTDVLTGGEDMYILPLERADTIDYALVRHVHISQQDPRHEWETMVDAHTGQVHWRWDRVRYGSVSGTASSAVRPLVPSDTETVLPQRDQWITVEGSLVTTDASGNYTSVGLSGNVAVSAELSGPYANVNRVDGPADASQSTNIDSDTDPTLDLLWDDSNSIAPERDVFYSTNLVHEWIKMIDPGFTQIDYSMPVNVNINATCNAFWDGNSINFYRAGGGCNNTAQTADVVYHEYGHGINDMIYIQAGQPLGMSSGALHEGMADVTAALLTDDPIVGDEFGTGGGIIRNMTLGNSYPDDVAGQVHQDGLIIGGAFWDLRGLVGLETARNLAHFAKYGRPDHQNQLRRAFGEYYQEVLIADDDDSDLSNGTPNFTEINQAFSAHGLGPSLFIFISHLQVEDAATDTQVEVVAQSFSDSPTLFPLDTSALKVIYTVDNGPQQELAMSNWFSSFYRAFIPGQPSGSIVRYWIESAAVAGETVTDPLRFDLQPYIYVVGDQINSVVDAFQTATGWTVGAPDDAATTGVWQRANPVGTGVQPENDHTPGAGTHCWVTGASSPDPQNAGANDVDGGKTTLTSIIYDMSGLTAPAVEWFRYFTNNQGAAPNQDPWIAQISNDAGANWVDVENTMMGLSAWFRVVFKVSDLVAPTDQMQFRFIATDDEPGSLVEALLDDFRIFDFADIATSVEDDVAGARRFAVSQNRPNPFNPSTEISFVIPQAGRTAVTVYDLAGRRVARLLDADLAAGSHSVRWTGMDDRGRSVASGVYLYSVEAGAFSETRRMVLAK